MKRRSESYLRKRVLVSEFQYRNSLFEDLVEYVDKNLWSSNKLKKTPRMVSDILKSVQIRKKREVVQITEWDVHLAIKKNNYMHLKEETK